MCDALRDSILTWCRAYWCAAPMLEGQGIIACDVICCDQVLCHEESSHEVRSGVKMLARPSRHSLIGSVERRSAVPWPCHRRCSLCQGAHPPAAPEHHLLLRVPRPAPARVTSPGVPGSSAASHTGSANSSGGRGQAADRAARVLARSRASGGARRRFFEETQAICLVTELCEGGPRPEQGPPR